MKKLIAQVLIAALILLVFYSDKIGEIAYLAVGLLALSTLASAVVAISLVSWHAIKSKFQARKRT